MLKLLGGIALFLLIVFLVFVFFSYRLVTESLPQTSGELSLSILDAPVHVYRDDFGVPHIFAENESDLFKASGFVTAQDRLWQMDYNRRIANGELAEILGKDLIETDRFLRLWGFSRIAKRNVDSLSEASRRVLQAYADGVNTYIAAHKDELPPEFALLDYTPGEWKIEDSLAYTRLIAWKLSMSWHVDLVLYRLVRKLGERKAREVFPDFPEGAPHIIPKAAPPFWTETRAFIDSGVALQERLGSHGARLGSNAWVVSGGKSECGKPLLANDPHLTLTTPSIWYELHLSGGGFDVAGVSFPGVPGVVIGHSRDMAWGMTNGMVDDADFYIEKVNPENKNQYLAGSTWRDFDLITEVIAVKDAPADTLRIRKSRNGIVVSPFHDMTKTQSEVVALRWVGQQASDEMRTFLQMGRARNAAEFVEALRHFKVPVQNFVFASREGDIGYYLGGAIPIRQNATGILPHQGWRETGQWLGEVAFEKQPHLLNPPEGFIATANNKIVDDRYPYYISNLWEPPSRVTRIRELLSAKQQMRLDDFKEMQNDVTSVHARQTLPIVLAELEARLQTDSDEELQKLYDLIKGWDGVEDEHSVAAAIFHAFFTKLVENVFRDEMGEELFQSYTRLANVPNRVLAALLRQSDSEWWDDVRTEQAESMQDIIVKSLLDGAALLKAIAGETVSDWAWGQIHTQVMAHPLGKRRPLDTLLNIGPLARGGSTMTINNAEYRYADPFHAVLGPSTRQLVDLCSPETAWSVLPTGQSGQRVSEHYSDQTDLWLNGQYHPMVMDREKLNETAPEHLILKPTN